MRRLAGYPVVHDAVEEAQQPEEGGGGEAELEQRAGDGVAAVMWRVCDRLCWC